MQETEQARQTVVGAADQMMPFTITHLVGIAIFAVIVILAIAWGMRMRVRRRAAERELEEIGQSQRVEPGAAVADPDAPGAAIAVEGRTAVEPTDIPAPAPPPVQASRSAAPVEPAAPAPAAAAASAPVAPAPVEVPAPVAEPTAPAPVVEPSAPAPAEPAPVASPVAPVPVPPAPVPPAPAAPAPSTNELTTLKGLGPKVAAQLAELGFTTVADLAALTPAEAERLDASLGAFQGRMARDRWIEQAQLLNAGDRAGYEAKFGKLG